MAVVLGLAAPASAERDHWELDMGFLSGARHYDDTAFSYEEGDASPAVLGPFRAAPYTGVTAQGVDTEMRITISGFRTTFGYAKPYPRFAPPQALQVEMGDGGTSTVQVRSLEVDEYRFGFGYEYDFGPLVGYADLLGTIDNVLTDLVVDDAQATYGAKSFSFSARGGVRVPIRRSFFGHLGGEVGLGGNIDYGLRAGLGVRIN